jgi:eukaryotic-like serine/threonine-protein kinase
MSVGERLATAHDLGSSHDDELTRVLDAYLAEVEAGRPADPEEWVARHPDIAERLRSCLKGLHLVEQFAGSIGAGRLDRQPGADGPTLGEYRIVRPLARGGMGVVYEAVQATLGRRVAVKVLPFGAAIDPRRLARFRIESQAAALLQHPHIIPVYSVGTEGGVHYYAMQLIEGMTVAELIAELRRGELVSSAIPGATGNGEKLSSILSSMSARSGACWREATRLGAQAALALEHAHQHGVLHRDVKPSNLMVDDTGHLWVGDFGLARFQGEESLTSSGDILGTLRYMSPEQALATRNVVDQRSDVYSLGATLYELLTLRPPFDGSSSQDLLRRIAQDEPRRPRAIKPEIPLDLETIVLKAMSKEPVSRYATARELADDLSRFASDQPIEARRPGPLERLTRFARKHTAAALVAVPLLLVIVAGLVIGFVMVLAKQSQILKQRAEIAQQKIKAEQAHANARRQRDEARRAVDEMYTMVAKDWLRNQPKLQPLQRIFLEKARAYYEEFAGDDDSDPAFRIAAAWASVRLAHIERELGKLDACERHYRQAIDKLEVIAAVPPTVREVLDALVTSYSGLGLLLEDTGRRNESKQAYRRAAGLERQNLLCIPETAANASLLAARYQLLGGMLDRDAQYQDAERAFKKAIALRTENAQPEPARQANTLSSLASALDHEGKRAEAERLFHQAIELYDALLEREPSVPQYRGELAETLFKFGTFLSSKSQNAEPVYRRAIGAFEKLMADAPEISEYRIQLAGATIKLANLCFDAERHREAEQAARQAVILLEVSVEQSPNHLGAHEMLAGAVTLLAYIHVKSGETSIALAEAQRGWTLYQKLRSDKLGEPASPSWNLAVLAQAHDRAGHPEESDKDWRLALAEFQLLVKRAPERLDYRSDLALYLMRFAESSTAARRPSEVERDVKRSFELLDGILKEAPERSVDRRRLARCARKLASLHFSNERLVEAERFSGIEFHCYERLVFGHDQPAVFVGDAAKCAQNKAVVQIKLGRHADAAKSMEQALKLFDALPPALSIERSVRASHGDTLDNLGWMHLTYGHVKEAEPVVRHALALRESLLADAPDSSQYQDAVGMSKSHLGEILRRQGAPAQAREVHEQAVALGQKAVKSDPRNRAAQDHLRGSLKLLALCLTELGAYVACAVVVDDLFRSIPPAGDSEMLMQGAGDLAECAFLALEDEKQSLASRRESALGYARKAMEAYEQAARDQQNVAATINLAWFLLAVPAQELKDTHRAERLLREVTGRSSPPQYSWAILGAAKYYCDDLPGAAAALEAERRLHPEQFGFWDFYVAMIHARQGRKGEARACFDRAESWMKVNGMQKKHERIRRESAAVLGLNEHGAARVVSAPP